MNAYIKYTKFVLLFVFLVIIAGSIVRTTQSGMGCPDWPHCYGRLMPPSSVNDLPPDYRKYLDKQDIDMEYNPVHAWVEYINRLITGALGILLVVHVGWSFKKFFSSRQSICWLSCLFLVGTLFEAWLGKLVVDTNLAVVKITLHMLGALFLALIPVLILHKLDNNKPIHDKGLAILTTTALIVLLLQIIIGTDVREQVDEISKALNYEQRDTWLAQLNTIFDVHRIVAVVTSLLVIFIFWRSLSHAALQKKALFLLLTVLLTAAAGFLMASLNIPAFIQPVHLLLSSVLFISLFAYRLNLKKQQ